MNNITFEWDKNKSRVNQKKHGVSFEEAESVFYDEYALEFYDEEHSSGEDRFLMLGLSFKLRVLVACHYVKELSDCLYCLFFFEGFLLFFKFFLIHS